MGGGRCEKGGSSSVSLGSYYAAIAVPDLGCPHGPGNMGHSVFVDSQKINMSVTFLSFNRREHRGGAESRRVLYISSAFSVPSSRPLRLKKGEPPGMQVSESGGAAQVMVTKINFMNQVHLRIFRNVQKEKKDVTVFSSAFFPASWNNQLSRKKQNMLSYQYN